MEQEKPISLRAYARHQGVTPMVVSHACKSGRLRDAVLRGSDGKVSGIIQSIADVEWSRNSDHTDSPQRAPQSSSAPEEGSLADAAARQKHWAAQLAELKYKAAAKELVPVGEIKSALEAIFSTCRTRVLSLPNSMKQALPHLTLVDIDKIEALVRECLTDLADNQERLSLEE